MGGVIDNPRLLDSKSASWPLQYLWPNIIGRIYFLSNPKRIIILS